MDNTLTVYLNGEYVTQAEAKISVFDQGVLFGDGVFEGIRVYNADECFLTGTAAEVVPVKEVDRRTIGIGMAGPVTKKLMQTFHTYAQKSGTPIYTEEYYAEQ